MAVDTLRVIAVASFAPAFPLLLAHGIVSHSPVPATGLVPLAFSSSASLFIILRHRKVDRDRSEETAPQVAEGAEDPSQISSRNSIIIFAADILLAAALLVTLVFTWLESANFNGQQATLATYGTIPLLVNFSIHLYFAVRSFSQGLALHDLTQYVAWQIVPADCPDCGHRLRPSSTPRIPWFESVRDIRVPRVRGLKTPTWRVPKWLKTRSTSDAALFVEDGEERYTDEPDGSGPSTHVDEPAEVAVTGKKSKKARDSPLLAEEEPDQPRW